MPDTGEGRDKQAHDREKRQREREILEELERWDETEPPVEADELEELETDLDALAYPATGEEVVEAAGDREVASAEGTYAVAELVPRTERVTFDSAGAVRARVQRPTVAAAMKRIVEASESLPDRDRLGSQREAYEKTLRELKAIDADDDDEGVEVIADWIVERIRDKGRRPSSRDVRRRAATFCRDNGYEIRNDDWLGV